MIDGEIVPSKKLRKELSRYGYATAFPQSSSEPAPTTPEDLSIAVCTPPSQALKHTWPSTLPWFQFEENHAHHLPNLSPNNVLYPQHLEMSIVLSGRISVQGATAVLDRFLPEMYEGQNFARAKPIISHQDHNASRESLKICIYALANSLIEDLGDRTTTLAFARRFLDVWGQPLRSLVRGPNIEPTLLALLEKCFQSACNSMDLDVMEMCLELGVSPDLTISTPLTKLFAKPIQLAAHEENRRAIDLLLRYGAIPDAIHSKHEPTALSISTSLYPPEVTGLDIPSLLIASGASILHAFRPQSSNAMWKLKRIASTGPRSWLKGLNPLSVLVDTLPYYLTTPSFSPFDLFQEYLDKAAQELHLESLPQALLAELILVAITSTDRRPSYPIAELIRIIVHNGGDINTESIHGVLPIALGSSRLHDSCSMLLSMGATPSLPCTSRYYHIRPSPLHCAAFRGDHIMARLLITAGAEVDHYINLSIEDQDIDTELVFYGYPWEWQPRAELPPQRLQQLHSPLQFALATSNLLPKEPSARSSSLADKIKVVTLLLDEGARLYGGELVDATELGDLKLVERLCLNHGAALDEKSADGWTSVQVAIERGFYKTAEFLIKSGARLLGREVCDAIVKRSPREFIDFLLEYSAASGRNVLSSAFSTGDIRVISQVLRLSPAQYDPYALCGAAIGFDPLEFCYEVIGYTTGNRQHKSIEAIEELLDRAPTANSSIIENTAIAIAARYGCQEVLKLFLRRFPILLSQLCVVPFTSVGDLINEHVIWENNWRSEDWLCCGSAFQAVKCSPVAAGIARRDGAIVDLLLRHGFRPDGAAISLAVIIDRRDMLLQMLKHGADPDQRCSELDTPLQLAIRISQSNRLRSAKTMIQDLLRSQASVNGDPAPAPWGRQHYEPRTALQLAVEAGNMELVQELLDAGADVNAPAAPQSGATALQLAAVKGFIGLAKMLIDEGANINAPGAEKAGRTALEIAAEHGRIDMLQLLLDYTPRAVIVEDGARQYIRAVRFAEQNGHMAAAMILRNAREWTAQDDELYKDCEELTYEETG